MDRANKNSYHLQSDTVGFIIYSRVKCCAQCEMCSTKTEYQEAGFGSWDDDPIPIQVTYCTQHHDSKDKIKDTAVLPAWCPMMKILYDRDVAAKGDPVDNALKSIFPNSA